MSSGSRKKRQSAAQSIGGMLLGFDQQVLRTSPPAEELVHRARPDGPVAAGDGSFVSRGLPDADPGADPEPENPWAGYEDLLDAEDDDEQDPWAGFDAEPAGAEPAKTAPADAPRAGFELG